MRNVQVSQHLVYSFHSFSMLKNVHVCSQSYLRNAITSHVWAIVGDALVASQNGDNYPPLAAKPGVELCFENTWSPFPLYEEW